MLSIYRQCVADPERVRQPRRGVANTVFCDTRLANKTERGRQPRHGVAITVFCDTRLAQEAYLRHQPENSAGIPGYPISPRVLVRFGYKMASMVALALHHAETLLVVLYRSGACAATTSRCRK